MKCRLRWINSGPSTVPWLAFIASQSGFPEIAKALSIGPAQKVAGDEIKMPASSNTT